MGLVTISLDRFNIEATMAELDAYIGQVVRKIGLDAQRNIMAANPVDTGFSRNQWIYTEPAGPYLPAHLTNSAEYIGYLNDGWSKQQPDPGWVELNAAAAARFWDR